MMPARPGTPSWRRGSRSSAGAEYRYPCRQEAARFMTETAQLARLLASRLQALWGAPVEISGLRQLPGGASRESWGVRARTDGGAERRLILMRDPGGSDRHRDVAVEAAAMAAAPAAGGPAPELYDHGADAL